MGVTVATAGHHILSSYFPQTVHSPVASTIPMNIIGRLNHVPLNATSPSQLRSYPDECSCSINCSPVCGLACRFARVCLFLLMILHGARLANGEGRQAPRRIPSTSNSHRVVHRHKRALIACLLRCDGRLPCTLGSANCPYIFVVVLLACTTVTCVTTAELSSRSISNGG